MSELTCLRAKVKKLKEENDELNQLFALQRTRMKEADELWRQATGRHDTIPDLGDLLAWLMNEARGGHEGGVVRGLVL